MKKFLFSPSTNRAIYYSKNNLAVTSEVKFNKDGFTVLRNIHSAPIDLKTMANSFSNGAIRDWTDKIPAGG